LLLTPAIDTRSVRRHLPSVCPRPRAFEREQDLLALVESDIEERGAVHCVLVDEAQFLTARRCGS